MRKRATLTDTDCEDVRIEAKLRRLVRFAISHFLLYPYPPRLDKQGQLAEKAV